MAGGEAQAVGEQLFRRLGVLHVGQENDHRAAAQPQGEVRHRVAEIGFDVLRPDRVQGLSHAPQLGAAALRLEEPADAVVERHETDPVAVRLRDPGQHQRRVDGVVQLVQRARRGGHQAPAVDGDHDLLALLRLDLDDDRPVAAGRRAPAHPADVVARHVVTQPGECGGRAWRPGAALARHRPQAAPERELDALDGQDAGEHRDLFSRRHPHLAPPPAAGPGNLEIDRAERESTTPRREDRVTDLEQP